MKNIRTLKFAALALLLPAVVAGAEPFSRYETIISRKPFGPEPLNFDPEAAPGSASGGIAGGPGAMTPEQRSAEQQQLAAKVRVSALNVTPSGTVKVGFVDTGANPPATYYIAVGASQNGWHVESADPATEMVKLSKDGVEVEIKLGEASGGKGSAGAAKNRKADAPVATPETAAEKPRAKSASEGLPEPKSLLGGLAKLRRRRIEEVEQKDRERERRREEAAAAEEDRKAREAEEAAKQREEEEIRNRQNEMLQELSNRVRELQSLKGAKEETGEADNVE